MPILSLEPTIYPDDLLECSPASHLGNDGPEHRDENDIDEYSQRRWWVAHTKARQEKCLARELLTHGIPFYLPLVRKTSVISGRRITAHVPLFAGYVFLHSSPYETKRTLRSRRLSRILDVRDGVQLQQDLQRVHVLINADAPLTVEARLAPGQRVRIRRGPMLGLEGTVLRRKRQTLLVVAVNLLQQGVSVEIDDFLLEPLD